MNQQKYKSEYMDNILRQLKNPFPVHLLSYRIGAKTKNKDKAIPLFYVTSRDIQKRLDDILGMENWKKETEIICCGNDLVAAKTTLSIKCLDGSWISKDGVGEPTKIAKPLGAESQSFKRAAAAFGIGRYLYFVHIGWQPIDEYGNFTQDVRTLIPKWAEPDTNIKNWEEIAEKEFDSELDLENLDSEIISEEEKELLRKSEEIRKKILKKQGEEIKEQYKQKMKDIKEKCKTTLWEES